MENSVNNLLVALLLSAVACHVFADEGLYLELGIGHDRHIDEGHNPQSVIRLRYEMENTQWWKPDVLEIDHHSSFQDGAPFNSNPEDTVGQASVIWRFKLK